MSKQDTISANRKNLKTKADLTHNTKSSALARGKRLKSLRTLADLSRKALEEKYHISASTIQSWEDGKAGGLTEKGARRVTNALRDEGIQCSIDWLLHGIGIGPQLQEKEHFQFAETAIPYNESHDSNNADSAIIQELLSFRRLNANGIDMVVIDDGMAPLYNEGDFVGGNRRYKQDIETTIGLDCIIETSKGETLLRRLKAGTQPGLYTILCTNADTELNNPAVYDVEVISAAPVIWLRRKEPKK